MHAIENDLGSHIRVLHALDPQTFTISSTQNGVAQTGRTIDRRLCGMPQTAVAAINLASTGLTNAKDIKASVTLSHSSDASSWETYTYSPTTSDPANPYSSSVSLLGSTTTSTNVERQSAAGVKFDLRMARRYIRLDVAPAWSATATGDAAVRLSGTLVTGGHAYLPASTGQGTVSSS